MDKEILYDRAFNRFYRAARELNALETIGGYKIDVVELAKLVLANKKKTSKQIKKES